MSKQITLLPEQLMEYQNELVDLKKRHENLTNEKKNLSFTNACSGSNNNTTSESLDSNLLLELSNISAEIKKLENLLNNCVVINAEEADVDFINIGTTFSCDTDIRKDLTMTLVEVNGNPMEGLISVDSPLGQAVYMKKVGEEFSYATPTGKNINGLITRIHLTNQLETEKVNTKK